MGWESNSIFQVLIVTGSTGSGVFVYSPSPGAGNLVDSIAAAAGTDPYGNAYKPGVTTYNPANSLFAELAGGTLSLGSQAAASRITIAGLVSVQDALADNVQPQMILSAPTTTGGGASSLTLGGTSKDGSVPDTWVLSPGGKILGTANLGDGLSVGQALAVQTLVNGSTINTAGVALQPVNCAAAVTGIILQAGTFDGQVMVVASNAAATRTITFAAAGTSNVSAGVAAVINPPLAMVLVWVASLSLWFPVQ